MDTLKTAVIVVLLLAVVYGAYVVLNQPDAPLPQEIAWHDQKATEPLQIDMGTPTAPTDIKVDTVASPQSWSSGSMASGAPKPFIHAELSPDEPEKPQVLSEPSPLGGLSPADQTTKPDATLSAVASSATTNATEPAVDAPNLLAGGTSESAAPAPTSEASEPKLPTLPDLRSTPNTANESAAVPAMTANAIPPTTDAGTGTEGSANSDAVLKASLEHENVGPITADEVAAKQDSNSSTGGSSSAAEYDAALAEAHLQIQNGKFNQALSVLSRFVTSPDLSPQQKAQLVDLVDPLAAKVVYSMEHAIEPAYEVRRGEKLSDIAEHYHVPWQLLANINGVENPDLLVPGTKLKVVPGPFRAEVNVQTNELTLFAGQLYAGRFPISVGKDPEPKPGEYRVLEKQVGRVYYAGDGRTIAADDPTNPYGRVWMGLGNDLCIHSSGEQSEPSTAGCISLSPLDANDVYNILSQGSTVIIRR